MIPIYVVITTRLHTPNPNYGVYQILLVKEMNLEDLDNFWKTKEYTDLANNQNYYGVNVHFFIREVANPFKNWTPIEHPQIRGYVIDNPYTGAAKQIEKETPEPEQKPDDEEDYYDKVWR